MQSSVEFGPWRKFFWPIYYYELRKIIPLFVMFFLISISYSLLRNIKDTLLINVPGSSIESIPYIKIFAVLPFTIFFIYVYTKLSDILSKQKLFYCTLSSFIIFFILFICILY